MCQVFGVPFFKFHLKIPSSTRNDLLDKVDFLRKKNRYKNKSNMGGFHSDDILEEEWNTFDAGKWFAGSINQILAKTMSLLHQTPSPEFNIELENSWYVVSRAGQADWLAPHNHPNSYLSGAFYLSVQPEIKGTGMLMAVIENNSIESIHPPRTVEYIPVEGEVILFPSSTLHMVSAHTADYDRIIISFNTKITPNNA